MLLLTAQPALTRPLEQIHAVGTDIGPLVKAASPDTIHIIILIQEHLSIHRSELFRGVHIKDKASSGIERLIDPAESLTAAALSELILNKICCPIQRAAKILCFTNIIWEITVTDNA